MMKVQLDGNIHFCRNTSKLEAMRYFRKHGLVPAPIYYFLDRRGMPETSTQRGGIWRDYTLYSADTCYISPSGEAKIVLNDPFLRDGDLDISNEHRGVVVSMEQWENMNGRQVLYMSARDVRKNSHRKYSAKEARSNPIWNFVARANERRLYRYTDRTYMFLRHKGLSKGMGISLPGPEDNYLMHTLSLCSFDQGAGIMCDDTARITGYFAGVEIHGLGFRGKLDAIAGAYS